MLQDHVSKERDVILSAIIKDPGLFRSAIEQAVVILYCTEGITGSVKDFIGASDLCQIVVGNTYAFYLTAL